MARCGPDNRVNVALVLRHQLYIPLVQCTQRKKKISLSITSIIKIYTPALFVAADLSCQPGEAHTFACGPGAPKPELMMMRPGGVTSQLTSIDRWWCQRALYQLKAIMPSTPKVVLFRMELLRMLKPPQMLINCNLAVAVSGDDLGCGRRARREPKRYGDD